MLRDVNDQLITGSFQINLNCNNNYFQEKRYVYYPFLGPSRVKLYSFDEIDKDQQPLMIIKFIITFVVLGRIIHMDLVRSQLLI